MTDLNESSTWEDGIYQIETTDPVVGGPDGISNVQAKQLGNRTLYLRNRIDTTDSELESLRQGVDEDAQTALWGEVLEQRSDLALLVQELGRQQTVRHQQGEVVIANRGVIFGAETTKSASATRNLSIAAGRIFLGGRAIAVDAQDNTAAVPSNSGDEAATCYFYARVYDGRLAVGCTELGAEAPDDALALDRMSIPAGNDELSDPYLDNVTITRVARTEPYWPSIQAEPAYADVTLPKRMDGSDYGLSLDDGGVHADVWPADRADNGFRIYLGGTADGVTVRWSATLMDQ